MYFKRFRCETKTGNPSRLNPAIYFSIKSVPPGKLLYYFPLYYVSPFLCLTFCFLLHKVGSFACENRSLRVVLLWRGGVFCGAVVGKRRQFAFFGFNNPDFFQVNKLECKKCWSHCHRNDIFNLKIYNKICQPVHTLGILKAHSGHCRNDMRTSKPCVLCKSTWLQGADTPSHLMMVRPLDLEGEQLLKMVVLSNEAHSTGPQVLSLFLCRTLPQIRLMISFWETHAEDRRVVAIMCGHDRPDRRHV